MRRLGALFLLPLIALAHQGEPLEPHDLWSTWSFEPGVVIPLLLALALISPLHPLGGALFCAHMAQHEILMLVAAPLLVRASCARRADCRPTAGQSTPRGRPAAS